MLLSDNFIRHRQINFYLTSFKFRPDKSSDCHILLGVCLSAVAHHHFTRLSVLGEQIYAIGLWGFW